MAPPVTFNPTLAGPEVLQAFGFPPKPDKLNEPKAYAAWKRAVTAPQSRLQTPVLQQTDIYHGPVKLIGPATRTDGTNEFTGSPSNIVATRSGNWSGFVDFDSSKPFAKGAIYAYWIVPRAQLAFGATSGNVDSSSWVGLDGYSNTDVLQAGTESDASVSNGTGRVLYAAWIEWYPLPSVRVPNFAVSPDDELFVEVWNTTSSLGHAYIMNVTNHQSVSLNFSAPNGTQLIGNSAEWIVERPLVGGVLATLTNYIACPFDDCYALASLNGGSYNVAYYPGLTKAGLTVYSISMHDNANNIISVPKLVGPTDIWFRDSGSAF
jgi:hypothetical protein